MAHYASPRAPHTRLGEVNVSNSLLRRGVPTGEAHPRSASPPYMCVFGSSGLVSWSIRSNASDHLFIPSWPISPSSIFVGARPFSFLKPYQLLPHSGWAEGVGPDGSSAGGGLGTRCLLPERCMQMIEHHKSIPHTDWVYGAAAGRTKKLCEELVRFRYDWGLTRTRDGGGSDALGSTRRLTRFAGGTTRKGIRGMMGEGLFKVLDCC